MPRESLHIEPQGVVGIARHYIRDATSDRWWRTGLEMLMLGGVVAVAAYAAGALVAALVN